MLAGRNYGIRNAGYYALRALRTEKFFAYWGTDLTPHTTPMECGREYRVKFDVRYHVLVQISIVEIFVYLIHMYTSFVYLIHMYISVCKASRWKETYQYMYAVLINRYCIL